MRGAREYASLFESGQHGRLYFVSGSHARGKTFRIYVLPSEEPIHLMPWSCKDAVEVYGIVSGHPGWTEVYGWLHKGPWVNDFHAIVKNRKSEIDFRNKQQEKLKIEAEEHKNRKTLELLSRYSKSESVSE